MVSPRFIHKSVHKSVDGDGGKRDGHVGPRYPRGSGACGQRRLPPFAVVSVDGGDTYWHRRASGADSDAMVLTELLPMLAMHGLDT